MTIQSYYPLSFLPIYPYPTEPISFNQDYINQIIALGITDYFLPTQFAQNPLFAQVDSFHQNIGILQTATKAIENILSYLDILKEINEPTQEILEQFSKEINDIIQNTTFNNLPVFSQTIPIGDKEISLNIPLFNPNETSIEEYISLLNNKKDNFIEALKELSLSFPLNQSPDYYNLNTLYTLLENGSLTQAIDYNRIDPFTLEVLLEM